MKRANSFRLILLLIFTGLVFSAAPAQYNSNQFTQPKDLPLSLPLRDGSVRFLAFGDSGSGAKVQIQLSEVMINYHKLFPYEFAIMMGDNIYGGEKGEDMKRKFEDVYKPLIDSKVKFYASLGNHDESNQRFYELFNMKGEEFYKIKKGDVSFYALNSNYMDKRQIDWLENELSKDTNKWKIAFFHHPLYSSGEQHGSDDKLREILEPILIKNGVDVVFAGHEHFYERIKPQKGIYHFISGAAGKLRKGDLKKNSPLTEKGYDNDLSFMLVEISKDEMHFQVISRTSETIDSGIIMRRD